MNSQVFEIKEKQESVYEKTPACYIALTPSREIRAAGDTPIEMEECETIKVELEEPINMDKFPGYILAEDNKLVFSKEKWQQHLEAEEQESLRYQEKEEGDALLKRLTSRTVLSMATDREAYIMRYQHELWEPDAVYTTGDRRLYGDNLYKCKQSHTSQANQPPDLTPALWDIINKEASGTKDDPIPVPAVVTSMIYIKGKYYLEDGALYLMNRTGMKDGEEISLTFKPSQLIDIYFVIVK